MNEESRYDAREAAAKAWASLIPVTVLDRDSRPLATGGLRPDTAPDQGLFLPHKPANSDHLSANAAFVLYSDGRKIAVYDFHRCGPEYPPEHYDFRVDRIS